MANNKKERIEELLDILSKTLGENLKELGVLVGLHKEAKTKVKKEYYQKKINHKREKVLGYMSDVQHMEKLLESNDDS